MRDYRQKQVDGYITDGTHFRPCHVDVRMTHDDRGASLSLTADDIIQIAIPLEQVSDIIQIVEKEDKDAH